MTHPLIILIVVHSTFYTSIQKDAKSYKIESLYSPFKQFANRPFLEQRASVDLFA